MQAKRDRRDRGFILIVVIWLAALLMLLALGFSTSIHTHLRLVSTSVQSAQAEAAADAGVQLAVMALMTRDPTRARRFSLDGTPSVCAVADVGTITLRIQDTGGKLNLNLAGERLLQAFFVGLGESLERASTIADTILDYRDPDNDRRVNGAERPEYEAAGRALGPKNAPFDTIEELAQVLGIDAEIMASARPHLTVHSQTAGLDPRATTPELASLVSRGVQQLPQISTRHLVSGGSVPGEFAIFSPQRDFLIVSEAKLAGVAYVREAVVEIQPSSKAHPTFKAWRRGRSEPLARAAVDGPVPPC
jgi:general secretion pathway protein K